MITDIQVQRAKEKAGEIVRVLRLRKEYSLYELAKRTGLHYSTIKSIEAGDKQFTVDSLLRILLALDGKLIIQDNIGTQEDVSIQP